jgi:uncharacterized protein
MHSNVKIPTPRYTDRTFPPYRFIPGKLPHPTRDPEGHSYKRPFEKLASFEISRWQSCNGYLYGIDLFNHGYWWEAHEALEAVWVAAGRQTETGLFIQGLIQVAVAHLKKLQGFNEVAKRMATKGIEKMKRKKGIYLGIEVSIFRGAVESYFSGDNKMPVKIELITE